MATVHSLMMQHDCVFNYMYIFFNEMGIMLTLWLITGKRLGYEVRWDFYKCAKGVKRVLKKEN